MKKIFCGLSVVVAVAVLATSFIRQRNAAPHSLTFMSMDTAMTLTAYGPAATDALEAARTRIMAVEDRLSTTRPEGDIGRLNRASGAQVSVSRDTAELAAFALNLSTETDGALDPTLYPILCAWGFTTGNYRVPPQDELADLLSVTGRDKMSLRGDSLQLGPGTMLDLGALGKGYASDQAIGVLRDAGISSAIVNLGGNVQTLGLRPDGTPWHVGIAAPEGGLLGTLEIRECAVITSGGYQRFFTGPDGRTYWHILDPRTGAPARSGVLSATVVAESGALCDGLSTSFFVMGAEKAAQWYREHGGIDFLLYTEDGELWLTEGLEKSFTPSSRYERAKVRVIRP